MKLEQIKNTGLIVISNLLINLSNFLRQVILAWFLGVSELIDVLLVAQIVPAMIQSMIGGGAGETSVIKGGDKTRDDSSFMALFITLCLLLVLTFGGIYYLFLDPIGNLFSLDSGKRALFATISIIYIVNMLPGTFTSILRPHLYAGGHYRFFTYSSVISQFVGLAFIVLTLKPIGIIAFPLSLLIANILNAFWFSYKAGIKYSAILKLNNWRTEGPQLITLMKRVFSVSLQTIIYHLGTFWERTLSVRYLSGGYLSSLSYSKNLADLPGTVLLSSVLTTSYIEQVNLFKKSFSEFAQYTLKNLKTIINLGLIFQILLLAFAPLIIIVIFRRGNFDNSAVESTLIIFNILTVGFLPKLLYGYFARTMFILGDYKRLLAGGFIRLSLHVGIMTLFINKIDHAIPFAILSGNIFIAVLLFYLTGRKLKVSSWYIFPIQMLAITGVSIVLYQIHKITLSYYLDRSTFEIILIYLPFVAISAVIMLLLLLRTETGRQFKTKLINHVRGRSEK